MSAKKFLHFLDGIENYMAQILLVFFVCILFSQIFLRVAFNYVVTWSEEISRFSFVWFVFFGASYAARLGAHNRVTVQFKLLPKSFEKVLLLLSDMVWIAFNIIMIKESIIVIQDLAKYKYHSPALGLSMEYVYYIFPISFALMTIRIIQVNYMKYILKMELKDVDKVAPEEYAELIVKEQGE